MKNFPPLPHRYLMTALFLAVACVCPPATAQKITAADLIAKHLESIGPAAGRASVKTRIIAGSAQVIFRTEPAGQAIGRAVLASEGAKTLLGMSFPSPVYPREQFGFNGSSFIAAFVTPGTRSVLGSFLMTNDVIFKQGLIGGVLSAAWPLSDLESRNARTEYLGVKKTGDRMFHALRFIPSRGSDLKITLFFEQDSFRHVRTEYERVIPAQIDTRSSTNVQTRESRYKMIEDFSSFNAESGLMLPHTYTIKLSVDTQAGTFLADWILNLAQFSFNDKIDPSSFNISGN